MCAKSNTAAVVVAALLGGCMQVPSSSYERPVPSYSVDDWIAAMRSEIRQQNARQAPVVIVPEIAPVATASAAQPEAKKPVKAESGNAGAIASENAAPSPASLATTPADTGCVGWWRICHFL